MSGPHHPYMYLGDGVYATYDGYQIVLDLRGQDSTTKIAMEPAVFEELVRFACRFWSADSIIDVARSTPPRPKGDRT